MFTQRGYFHVFRNVLTRLDLFLDVPEVLGGYRSAVRFNHRPEPSGCHVLGRSGDGDNGVGGCDCWGDGGAGWFELFRIELLGRLLIEVMRGRWNLICQRCFHFKYKYFKYQRCFHFNFRNKMIGNILLVSLRRPPPFSLLFVPNCGSYFYPLVSTVHNAHQSFDQYMGDSTVTHVTFWA